MIAGTPNPLEPFMSRDFEATDDEASGDSVDRILLALRKHLGVEIAFVSRYVENNEREFTHISTDLPIPHRPGMREPREESYCWHVLEGRLPQLIHDAQEFSLAKTLPITNLLPVGCHLNVPLRLSDGSVYGSFCCLSREANMSMTPRDLSVLKSFAALAVEQIETTLEGDTRRLALSETIGRLIEGDQLTILHQPIHSLETGRPVGVECLARFPDAGKRGPDKWFNEAGEVGLGVELEMLAVRCAIATMPFVPAGHYASVNVSPETVMSGVLEQALGDYSSDRLVIEVTEHHRVEDFQALAASLKPLKNRARIAIDDVGAGYAGLRHIVDLAPDILKLDMSLTRDIHRDPARHALAGAMVHFASEIGCSLVAEGVEVAEERDALAKLGVLFVQGYLFSKPMPVVAAQQLLMGVAEHTDEPIALPSISEADRAA